MIIHMDQDKLLNGLCKQICYQKIVSNFSVITATLTITQNILIKNVWLCKNKNTKVQKLPQNQSFGGYVN